MKFKLEISLGSAAFQGDSFARPLEVARILGEVRRKIVNEGMTNGFRQKLFDANGNSVGTAKLVK